MALATEESPIRIPTVLNPTWFMNKFPLIRFKANGMRLLVTCLLLLAHECVAQVQSRPYSNIRQVDFRNFTYRVAGFLERPSDFHLQNGSYVENERGVVTYSVKLMTVAYGDVTGDGEEDAAVVLVVSGGGTGFVTEGAIYTLRNGRAVMLSGFEAGEGGHAASIQTISIAGGRLNVVYVNGSGSTHSIGYRWDGRSLVRIRETGQTKGSSSDYTPMDSKITDRYFVRLFNCDDSCIARIDDQDIASTGFGKDSGWIELGLAVRPTTNRIRFLVFNGQGAIAYGFQVRKNDTVVFEEICGQAGRFGCENNRTFPNNSLARTFSYELVSSSVDTGRSLTPSSKPPIGQSENWDTFWNSFRVAVSKRDIKTLASLMEDPFNCGGELFAPADCLKEIIKNDRQFWRRMDRAARAGTKLLPRPAEKDAARSSRDADEYLAFALKNGRWFLWQIGTTL